MNYFYVDESGDTKAEDGVFVLGCIKTSSPELISNSLNNLLKEFLNSAFYSRHWDDLKKYGLHASTNHFDIYSRVIQLAIELDFRSYFVIYNKTLDEYKEFDENSVYDKAIWYLLRDRVAKGRDHKNVFVFEQNLSKQTKNALEERKNEISEVISKIEEWLISIKQLDKNSKLEYEVQLHDKSDIILSLIDYLNHIVSKIYCGDKENKLQPYMVENFRLVEPKIGCIYEVVENTFHSPRKKLLTIKEKPKIWSD